MIGTAILFSGHPYIMGSLLRAHTVKHRLHKQICKKEEQYYFDKTLDSVTCSSMLRLVFSECYAFNSSILYLPDIIREDVAKFFQVGDVEQGNLLIIKFVEV